MEQLLGSTLSVTAEDGNVYDIPTNEHLQNKKTIMLYFSAHWCPPCRQFTPVLISKYMNRKDKSVEVIFISSDQDQTAFDQYFGDIPWSALPFQNRSLKNMISTKFGVRGIPSLVILDGNGALITTEGRGKESNFFDGAVSSKSHVPINDIDKDDSTTGDCYSSCCVIFSVLFVILGLIIVAGDPRLHDK